MRRLAAVTGSLLLLGLGLDAGAATARAAEAPRTGFHLIGGLHLKKSETTTGKTDTTYLGCFSTRFGSGPTTVHGIGGMADADSACLELVQVDGDFDRLAVHPTWLPPAVVAPVEVRAAGTWEGHKVRWSHTFTNDGWLAKQCGDVFGF